MRTLILLSVILLFPVSLVSAQSENFRDEQQWSTLDEQTKRLILETGNEAAHYINRINDIFAVCDERFSVVNECIELLESYNNGMRIIFNNNSDVIETILYN